MNWLSFDCLFRTQIILPPPRIPTTSTSTATKWPARRMTRRMAGITASARRTWRITATTTTAIMHQLRNHHYLREGLAAMLALVGHFFLAVVRIIRLDEGLRFGQLQGVCATFWAGFELVILASFFLHHKLMAVSAMVGRKFQRLYPGFTLMGLRQMEAAVPAHALATCRALKFTAMLYPRLQSLVIYHTEPWSHPHCNLVGGMFVCCLVDFLGLNRLFRQCVGHLQDAVVLAETHPSEV